MSITNGMFEINGKVLPYPDRGIRIERQQLVDSARNALGQVVAQKINRRLFKVSELKWGHLTAEEWHDILVEIEKFEGTLAFWNSLSQTFETKRVYWGDASEEIFKINPATGEVLEYVDCSCNVIDMGY